MKNPILLFVCLLPVVFIHAQGSDTSAHATMILPVRRPNVPAYMIDGFQVSNAASTDGIICWVPMPILRMEGTTIITSAQLKRLPQRNINAIAGTVAGVDSRAGQIPNIRGARQDATAYYIDGVRIREVELTGEIK
jgi:hypothetical protein